MEERSISFTLFGPPRTKKNSRRHVKLGNFLKVIPSKAYMNWFKRQMDWSIVLRGKLKRCGITLPIQGSVKVCAVFFIDRRGRGDLDGYCAGIGDFLQSPKFNKNLKQTRDGADIITDDRCIVSWDGSHIVEGDPRPRIEVSIHFDGELNRVSLHHPQPSCVSAVEPMKSGVYRGQAPEGCSDQKGASRSGLSGSTKIKPRLDWK